MSSFSERNASFSPNVKKMQRKSPPTAVRPRQASKMSEKPVKSAHFQRDQRSDSPPPKKNRPSGSLINHEGLLWGVHCVEAALANPKRASKMTLFATQERFESLKAKSLISSLITIEVMDAKSLSAKLPNDVVHQGLALKAPLLDGVLIEDIVATGGLIVMLDQITDVQNIGAIFRSSAAFGVKGLIFQDRHTPEFHGALAKTAAGALEKVPFCRVTNLSRALETLDEGGFIAYGLDGEASLDIGEAFLKFPSPNRVLVMGSEGAGLRRLVSEHCHHTVRIPMPGGFESLNVAHATSLALYEAIRPHYS